MRDVAAGIVLLSFAVYLVFFLFYLVFVFLFGSWLPVSGGMKMHILADYIKIWHAGALWWVYWGGGIVKVHFR